MKLVIQGREYDLVNPQTATLLHLMELRQQTRGLVDGGIGARRLGQMAARMDAAHQAQERGEAPDVDDDEALLWLGILVFLARRAAGEKITFTDAVDIPGDAVDLVAEPGDEVPVEGPRVPAVAGDAAGE